MDILYDIFYFHHHLARSPPWISVESLNHIATNVDFVYLHSVVNETSWANINQYLRVHEHQVELNLRDEYGTWAQGWRITVIQANGVNGFKWGNALMVDWSGRK